VAHAVETRRAVRARALGDRAARVFFYGNGGSFGGEIFERWYRDLEATRDLRLYVGGAGDAFTFPAGERARGNELLTRKRVRFEVVSENPRHRLLRTTARLLGVELHLHGWNDSRAPFAKLEATSASSTHSAIAD
jgi:hypothetical protein